MRNPNAKQKYPRAKNNRSITLHKTTSVFVESTRKYLLFAVRSIEIDRTDSYPHLVVSKEH